METTKPIPNDLASIKAEVDRLAAIIEVPPVILPAYDHWIEGYHVEHKYGGFHLVHVERGNENARITVSSAAELLYHIFSKITWNMAEQGARQFRDCDVDYRRVLFKNQIELLARLSNDWALRAQVEQAAVLAKYPYDDFLKSRTHAFKNYLDEGLSREAALQKALERYPKYVVQ